MAAETTTGAARRRLGHEPALDGVRGIAVLLVVLWHYPTDILERQFSWLRSGHLGVDLFFVLSGFLITALMLNEHAADGSISFAGFYRRRVFRLLPALFVFLAAHIVFANLTDIPNGGLFSPGTDGSDQVASILGAAFFVLNWLDDIGSGYDISLGLGHLWSLSVEEQYYIVWPAITVAMLTPRSAINRAASAGAGGAVVMAGHNYVWNESADTSRWLVTLGVWAVVTGVLELIRRSSRRSVWIVSVIATTIGATLLYRNGSYEGGPEVFRLYAGTFSRADSLMVGSGFAFLWVEGWVPRRCPTWLSCVAWAFFVWAVTARSLSEPFFFEFGWTLVALSGALILWGALGAEGTVYGRVLSMAWLRGVGKVAYGLYLWHALVFIAVRHWWGDGSTLWKTVLALGLTALVTAASWFLVEKPMLAFKTPARRRDRSPSRV